MRTVPVLLALTILAACGSEETTSIATADGGEAIVTTDSNGGDTEVRITTGDGEEAVITSGSNVAADLPQGFTPYPGATLVSNSNISTNDGKGSVLSMTTSDSPAEVTAFYRRQAEAAGIAIGMETTTKDAMMLAGESPDGKSIMLTSNTTGEGTTVQLMLGEKP